MGASSSSGAGGAAGGGVAASGGTGGCPVVHTARPSTSEAGASVPSRQDPQGGNPAVPASGSGGCPVRHGGNAATSSSSTTTPAAPPGEGQGEQGGRYRHQDTFNVYSQKINAANRMPAAAQQQRSPGQSVDLPRERVASTIPKGGADEGSTWQYPSPQMFWNALHRKGKVGDTQETDIEVVVAIHNNMNEKTWKNVLLWEALHETPAGREDLRPKLLRFCGRPDERSPKAWIKEMLSHPAPFDRHDWIVDRGGREVRYVIDYYHDESQAGTDRLPRDQHDAAAMESIKVDVRPALDNVEAVWDRVVVMPWMRLTGKTQFQPLPLLPSAAMRQAAAAEEQRMQAAMQEEKKQLEAQFQRGVTKCLPLYQMLHDCKQTAAAKSAGEEFDFANPAPASPVCGDEALIFSMCMFKTLSPEGALQLADTLQQDDEDEQAAGLKHMADHVEAFMARAEQAGLEWPPSTTTTPTATT